MINFKKIGKNISLIGLMGSGKSSVEEISANILMWIYDI